MPRFVVLHHVMPPHAERADHWDLMLEARKRDHSDAPFGERSLRTWAMPCPLERGKTVLGQRLQDHRDVYLEFEGKLTGGRGSVTREMSGLVRWLHESEGRYVVQLETSQGTVFDLAITREDSDQFSISVS